jgi:hypothetical protein
MGGRQGKREVEVKVHLRAHKYILTILLLFGLGFLVGTTMDVAYRRYTRERAALLYAETLKSPAGGKETAFLFPKEVAGMPRSEMLAGDQARTFMCGYLGHDKGLTEAYIGTFTGTKGEVVIFLAMYPGNQQAAAVREAMEKSFKTKPPFEDHTLIRILDGIPIHSFLDKKTTHYFFTKGSRLLWLSVKSEDPAKILLDAYERF